MPFEDMLHDVDWNLLRMQRNTLLEVESGSTSGAEHTHVKGVVEFLDVLLVEAKKSGYLGLRAGDLVIDDGEGEFNTFETMGQFHQSLQTAISTAMEHGTRVGDPTKITILIGGERSTPQGSRE